MGEKKCNTCGKVKPLISFWKNKARRLGVDQNCIPCAKLRKKRYQAIHYINKRDEYINRAILKKYNITLEEYVALKESQDYRCAICGVEDNGGRWTGLCLDHNHTTGVVRAFVCRRCNMAISIVDDVAYLEKVVQYVEEHK